MSRRVAWILVLAILLAPVLGTLSSPTRAFADDAITTEETTDGTVEATPTDEITEITPEPSSTPEESPT
ncbi:MAG: hypothetical protein IRY92_08990, partial [Dactylosporangium sp.]|nr:hypothetical protein [Dactylosporangium sp.]